MTRCGYPELPAFSPAALGGCATAPEPPGAVEDATPAPLLADGDAALERGATRAATAYRRAAERPTTSGLPNRPPTSRSTTQLQETARAAERWLELNPTSEQARRHAGVAALQLHRLDAADTHFTVLLDSAYKQDRN